MAPAAPAGFLLSRYLANGLDVPPLVQGSAEYIQRQAIRTVRLTGGGYQSEFTLRLDRLEILEPPR